MFLFLFFYILFYFFFFQAEDGIRDRDMTGVQTCALPILCLQQMWRSRASRTPLLQGLRLANLHSNWRGRTDPLRCTNSRVARVAEILPASRYRSEERRVGKECRSRWAQCR